MGGRGLSRAGFGAESDSTNKLAGGGVVEGFGKEEQALARKILGHKASAQEIATLAGADAFKGAVVEVGIRDGRLQIDVSHKHISKTDGMTRTLYKDARGRVVIYNEAFFLTKSAQGKGLGTESFRTQIQQAKDSKVSHINTFALRNDARADKAIGYRVWADLGYDGILPSSVVRAWEGRNPLARFSGTKPPATVRELYNMRNGRSLWHEKGESISMVFSLRRGSDSLKALNKHLKDRGKPTIK